MHLIRAGIEESITVWKKIGACPLTRVAVRHEVFVDSNGVIDIDADPLTTSSFLELEK